MKTSKYSHEFSAGRHWALHRGKRLGAAAHNIHRLYAFPLLTPSGICVIQEAPADHPHHQGIMCGQDLVNGYDFWHSMHARNPRNRQELDGFEAEIDAKGVSLVFFVTWQTADSTLIARERRIYRWELWEEGVFVEVGSELMAEFGPIYIGKTKEGGMGMRVHYDLETAAGGIIRSSEGKVGEKEVFDSMADWIGVAGKVEGRESGIVMMPHPSMPRVPWFTRDYGAHIYSPRRHAPAEIAFGKKLGMRVAYLAHDGGNTAAAGAAAWGKYGGRERV